HQNEMAGDEGPLQYARHPPRLHGSTQAARSSLSTTPESLPSDSSVVGSGTGTDCRDLRATSGERGGSSEGRRMAIGGLRFVPGGAGGDGDQVPADGRGPGLREGQAGQGAGGADQVVCHRRDGKPGRISRENP